MICKFINSILATISLFYVNICLNLVSIYLNLVFIYLNMMLIYNKLIILNVKMERGLGKDFFIKVRLFGSIFLNASGFYPLELELTPAEFQLHWKRFGRKCVLVLLPFLLIFIFYSWLLWDTSFQHWLFLICKFGVDVYKFGVEMYKFGVATQGRKETSRLY